MEYQTVVSKMQVVDTEGRAWSMDTDLYDRMFAFVTESNAKVDAEVAMIEVDAEAERRAAFEAHVVKGPPRVADADSGPLPVIGGPDLTAIDQRAWERKVAVYERRRKELEVFYAELEREHLEREAKLARLKKDEAEFIKAWKEKDAEEQRARVERENAAVTETIAKALGAAASDPEAAARLIVEALRPSAPVEPNPMIQPR